MDGPEGLLVVGDGPVSEALVAMTGVLGWRPTVATTLPEVEAALPSVRAVVVTSHDEEVDAAAIARALDAGVDYLGGMGSRPTQARRRAWLLDHGVTEERLASVRGPAGLDIGADGPAEIALSILAEALAVLRGVEVTGAISDRDGPIHPDKAPGEAFCPTG
ncbi:XdhC family protein [Nocardioides caldifontis]|uniref:XdhC family protein n=1 Tax=Nocardioides caldifontis TaxID=2588938 RepID=UPI001396B0DB|nr:XdhC family protein [Nocardioides caldifontis]